MSYEDNTLQIALDNIHSYVDAAERLRKAGVIISIGISNGADGKPVKLVNFTATKTIKEYKAPAE